MKSRTCLRTMLGLLSGALLLAAPGCGGGSDDPAHAETTEQSATQLDAAFADASAGVKKGVTDASEALRKQNYQKAVVSLGVVQTSKDITLEQGMAIHGSMISLEAELISAMESGDKNAEKAYRMLRAMKRN